MDGVTSLACSKLSGSLNDVVILSSNLVGIGYVCTFLDVPYFRMYCRLLNICGILL